MTEQSVCPHCEGTGWKTLERDGVSAVERCECALSERVHRLEEKANIPPLYRDSSFDNFSTLPDNPIVNRVLSTAVVTARSYAREFPSPAGMQGLLFIGDPGTGKTHLATAVLRNLISKGFEGVFFLYQHLLDKIRSGYDKSSGSSDREAYRVALDCEILLLDDLGAHRVSDWVEDTITSIITHRCNHNKPLIATTNLRDPRAGDGPMPTGAAGDLASRYYLSERIGSRARSRLFEMCRVVSTRGAEDYRMRQGR